MTTLSISKRDTKTKLDSLRADGQIPAVVYGKKFESTSIALSAGEFAKAFKVAGESGIIKLSGDGIEEDVIVHDVAYHPVSDEILHADFYVIEKGQKVVVHIPLEFTGVAPAVKELGGTLVKVMHEVEVEGEPKNLPHTIEVDISSLVDFDSQIHAKDLKLPASVMLKSDSEDVVALVQAHQEEKEEEVVFDADAIAVEDKGKKDEEAPAE